MDSIKSIYETGTSETCNSLSWNPHNENILLAGVNSKSLKIFDIRGLTLFFIIFLESERSSRMNVKDAKLFYKRLKKISFPRKFFIS